MTKKDTRKEGGGPARIPVAVAIVMEGGRLLIAHRFPHPLLPDLWEFPGGKIEPGESPEMCAIRETAEELGIEIEVLGLLMKRPYDYADRRVDLWFFVARRVAGILEARGCQEWRWVDPEDLARYPLPDADAPVIDALRAGGWIRSLEAKEAEVLVRRLLAPDVIELIVQPSIAGGERFRAGQYLMVEVGRDDYRAYSIASPPSAPVIELCIRRIPEGAGSDYIASLASGDRIRYTGPHGDFIVRAGSPRDRLFIATGTGVAPFRSMIRDLLENGETGACDLLFGARTEDDLVYFDEFRALEGSSPNFRYHPCVSQPAREAGRGAFQGRVTTLLPEVIPSARNRDIYLCGGSMMIRDAIGVLSQLGCDPARCFAEAWY